MKGISKRLLLFTILTAIALSGCSGAVPLAKTPTPTLTNTPAQTNTLTPSSTAMQTSTVTQTPIPTLTPTPEPKPAFYDPIQTYMVEHAPSFSDDFSQKTTDMWGRNPYDGHSFSSTTRDYSLQINTNGGKLPTNGLLNSADFAMSFEYALVDATYFAHVFRTSWDETAYYQFKYSRGGHWSLIHDNGVEKTILESGNFQPVHGSEANFRPESGDRWSDIPMNNFLFIVKDEDLAILINNQIIVEFNELASYGDKNFFIPGEYWSKMADFRLWRLTNVDFHE